MKRFSVYLILLVVIFLLPLALRKKGEAIDLEADQLVVVSPHDEAVRFEFEQAFRRYYLKKTGRKVCIDWRSLGGTSEIVRYVYSAYTANFRQMWEEELNREWTGEVSRAFLNGRLPADAPGSGARRVFLEKGPGIGVDLFFGGGQYDLNKLAQAGILVPCGVRKRHPEWFSGEKPILVEGMGGERWYDAGDRYYATCFSTFGICANIDRLKALGFHYDPDQLPLTAWTDLADPRFFGALGIADPTKSGSINKCFEMIIQRTMQDVMAGLRNRAGKSMTEQQMLDRAWEEAMTVIKKIGGNSAYLTFSAGKVPMDVARGQVAAGMCIDFYGRCQEEWEENHVGRETMFFTVPEAGSTVSGDPIGMLRGAPHPELARMFIDFILSEDAQRLWNYRAGTPEGPQKYTLHRLPVRRDLYTPEHRSRMHARKADPFGLAGNFTYQGRWTAPYFSLLRVLIRVMVIDNHEELQQAWKDIIAAGGPEKCPRAMAELSALPFTHGEAAAVRNSIGSTEKRTEIMRQWLMFFREHYQEASRLAVRARQEREKRASQTGASCGRSGCF